MDGLFEERKQYLRVDVGGKSPEIWNALRGKLIHAVNKFLDSTIDTIDNKTIRQEAQAFTHALLEHAKEKLAKAGIENQKLLAEIDYIFSQREKEIAEARKINAEAHKIEIENSLRQLKLSLGMAKALLIGEEEGESIIFVKKIDAFLDVIKEFNLDK
jgi:hypothetical protein